MPAEGGVGMKYYPLRAAFLCIVSCGAPAESSLACQIAAAARERAGFFLPFYLFPFAPPLIRYSNIHMIIFDEFFFGFALLIIRSSRAYVSNYSSTYIYGHTPISIHIYICIFVY